MKLRHLLPLFQRARLALRAISWRCFLVRDFARACPPVCARCFRKALLSVFFFMLALVLAFRLYSDLPRGSSHFMEIKEAEVLAAKLADDITALLQKYESATGALVHSVPVVREPKAPVKARVKVQLS